MQYSQKLQEENERLRAELMAYKETEKTQKQRKGKFIRNLSSLGSWFFLGGDLKQSIKELVNEVSDKDQQVSKNTVGDVLAHGAWRFTRIGCFAVIMATIPFLILLAQTTLLYYQNKKIDAQNELFKNQNEKVAEQTNLMKSQNSLLATQNIFFKRQLGQIDTQIEQAGIQNQLVKQQNIKIEHQNQRLDQQTYLQEAERRGSLVFLFSNIMDAINNELQDRTKKDSIRMLSPQLIGRIIALSSRLKPYKYLENDSLINLPLSPERGQLLVSLVESNLDSSSSRFIFGKGNFSHADLRGVILRGANLVGATFGTRYASTYYLYDDEMLFTGINLTKANLENADLTRANLSNANLTKSNLKNASMEESNLDSANLSNANFSYANLAGANLSNAILTNTTFNKADLSRVKFIKSKLTNADFTNSNIWRTTIRNSNLDKEVSEVA